MSAWWVSALSLGGLSGFYFIIPILPLPDAVQIPGWAIALPRCGVCYIGVARVIFYTPAGDQRAQSSPAPPRANAQRPQRPHPTRQLFLELLKRARVPPFAPSRPVTFPQSFITFSIGLFASQTAKGRLLSHEVHSARLSPLTFRQTGFPPSAFRRHTMSLQYLSGFLSRVAAWIASGYSGLLKFLTNCLDF